MAACSLGVIELLLSKLVHERIVLVTISAASFGAPHRGVEPRTAPISFKLLGANVGVARRLLSG